MRGTCCAGPGLDPEGSLRVCDAPPQTVALDDAHAFLPHAACLATVGPGTEGVGQVGRLGRDGAADVLALPAIDDTTHLGVPLHVLAVDVEEVLTMGSPLAEHGFLSVQLPKPGLPVREPGFGRGARWFSATPSPSRRALFGGAVLRVAQALLEPTAHAGEVGQLALWTPGRGAQPVGDGLTIGVELSHCPRRQAELAGRVYGEILGRRAVDGAGHFGEQVVATGRRHAPVCGVDVIAGHEIEAVLPSPPAQARVCHLPTDAGVAEE